MSSSGADDELAAGIAAMFADGGHMGALMAGFDWASTPVGPTGTWPQSLRSILSVLLTSQQPIFLWWGPELVQFYNDAYRPILGTTMHPAALGERGSVTWLAVWDVIAPMIDAVMKQGQSTRVQDGLLVLDRNGYQEEAYFDYAYSPIRDESGRVGGIFAACGETTTRVIGERRLALLVDLGADVGDSKTVQSACDRAMATLASAEYDVPFAVLYLNDDESGPLAVAAGGMELADAASVGWPIAEVIASREAVVVDALDRAPCTLPGGPWPEPAHTAVVIPLEIHRHGECVGALILGVSPRRELDDEYRSFMSVVGSQIASAVASARAREEEHARAEALAELNAAKTAFFSNVSHEFRTPLTLLLGPLEEALAAEPPDGRTHAQLELAYRNAQRLLRLTNSLLEFSRAEAGGLEASFVPVDLGPLTTELASAFVELFEDAGIEFVVDCPAVGTAAFVDVDVWEKVVLNLLSNAFKFTFSGSVTVSLRREGDQARLVVRDTGEGIPPEDLDRVFERFHRVKATRSRIHEGTGIGLALVKELVARHGGDVIVESTLGTGTTFTVTIPLGTGHLPDAPLSGEDAGRDHDAEPRPATNTGAIEALRANATEAAPDRSHRPVPGPPDGASSTRPTVLVVDDNADMREYLTGILEDRYDIRLAADGALALDSVAEFLPDLILTDVMMPNVDGTELVDQLRRNEVTASIPIVMLSARAGPEAAVDGLDSGADDYLAKPFTAVELLARCRANLKLARLRNAATRTAERRYREEHDVALLLQHALFSETLPRLAGVELAAHYQASAAGVDVGGDWYDVIDAGDGQIVAVVGDVVGHDLHAAVVMAQLRNVLRAYAIEDTSPARILERVDEYARQFEFGFATVAVASLDTASGRLRYSLAGHLPPIVAGPAAPSRLLDLGGGQPVGVAVGTRTETIDRLQPGETLLLYTDGLVERRAESLDVGIDRLMHALSETVDPPGGIDAALGPDLPARLVEAVAGTDVHDDIALLATRFIGAVDGSAPRPD